ncbi:MAG TPA: response regulator [Bacteroidia bacterium]|nr:response regulator [Bacteroidia bacterium]
MFEKTILIVDDDSRNIFALSANLRAKGFQCLSSVNGIEALNLLGSNQTVHAVLMDMMMPDMDGYEAIPAVKKLRKGIPVVAVTAQAMPGDREKCLEAGADGYISKPIDLDKLLELLAKFKVI